MPFQTGQQRRVHMEDQLAQLFTQQPWSLQEKKFATFLTYGVLRHWYGLMALIAQHSKFPVGKIASDVTMLIQMGLFQLMYMDSVPNYAAVSSTLELADQVGCSKKAKGFMNAILQAVIRKQCPKPSLQEHVPIWWLERLNQQYGAEEVTQILEAQCQVPTLSLRVNTLRIKPEDYHHQLREANVAFEVSESVPEVLRLTGAVGEPTQLPGYAEGLFVVQDEAAARIAHVLSPQPRDYVLEVGAAPGTKTTQMAALMTNQGELLAVDVSESRMELLAENCQRLGVTVCRQHLHDMTVEGLQEKQQTMDRVLIDAPCSGTGVIAKHPEILLTLTPQVFTPYADTQKQLLKNTWGALKPGGTLVYSTCSIDSEENQQVVAWAVEHSDSPLTLVEENCVLPNGHHDGFYWAVMHC